MLFGCGTSAAQCFPWLPLDLGDQRAKNIVDSLIGAPDPHIQKLVRHS